MLGMLSKDSKLIGLSGALYISITSLISGVSQNKACSSYLPTLIYIYIYIDLYVYLVTGTKITTKLVDKILRLY